MRVKRGNKDWKVVMKAEENTGKGKKDMKKERKPR
jgi:hypothetical protein